MKRRVHLLVTLLLYVGLNLLLAVSWHLVFFRDVLDAATPFARTQPIIPLGVDVGKFEFHDARAYLLLETTYEVLSFAVLGAFIAYRHRPEQRFSADHRELTIA